ncbi:hypothetical protein [Micromonospora chersina]|uniref:hypothetical protein n=1 Tax=Micromonospora chersina TaxID=47854 RepID=UPI00371225E8
MKEEMGEQHPSAQGFHVPWTWATMSLLVVAAASLGTLAVVVSIKDVDVLSTIALALAVLAFAAQLIVSLAQAQGSAHQLSQTERINSQTQSTLTEVRSTAQALLTNQSDQFNKVLAAALKSATESAVREVAEAADTPTGEQETADDGQRLDPEEIADQVQRRLQHLFTQPSVPKEQRETSWYQGERLSLSMMRQSIDEFLALDGATVFGLSTLVTGMGVQPLRFRVLRWRPILNHLEAAGVVQLRGKEGGPDGPIHVRLTEKGARIAVLLHGEHPRTSSHPSKVLQLLDEARGRQDP